MPLGGWEESEKWARLRGALLTPGLALAKGQVAGGASFQSPCSASSQGMYAGHAAGAGLWGAAGPRGTGTMDGAPARPRGSGKAAASLAPQGLGRASGPRQHPRPRGAIMSVGATSRSTVAAQSHTAHRAACPQRCLGSQNLFQPGQRFFSTPSLARPSACRRPVIPFSEPAMNHRQAVEGTGNAGTRALAADFLVILPKSYPAEDTVHQRWKEMCFPSLAALIFEKLYPRPIPRVVAN